MYSDLTTMPRKDPTDGVIRVAIWREYKARCFFCGDLIDRLGDMHLDHYMPRTLRGTETFKEICQHDGIPDFFEFDSYYNLVPTHPACNLKKSDRIFTPTTRSHSLEEILSHVKALEIEEAKIRKNIASSEPLGYVYAEWKAGSIQLEEIERLLESNTTDALIITFAYNRRNFETDLTDDHLSRVLKDKLVSELKSEFKDVSILKEGQISDICFLKVALWGVQLYQFKQFYSEDWYWYETAAFDTTFKRDYRQFDSIVSMSWPIKGHKGHEEKIEAIKEEKDIIS